MNAMYEKKLALQAESYMQLKVAYEELSQVLLTTALSGNPRLSPPGLFSSVLPVYSSLSGRQ